MADRWPRGDPGWVMALADSLGQSRYSPLGRLVPLPLEVAFPEALGILRTGEPRRETLQLLAGEWRTAVRDDRQDIHALHGRKSASSRLLSDLVDRPTTVVRSSSDRAKVIALLEGIVSDGQSGSSLGARWDDTVSAFRSQRSTSDRRAWAIDRLRLAWIGAGRDWPNLVSRVTGILSDSTLDIRSAKGDLAAASDPGQLVDQSAGLSLKERVELCRSLFTAEPRHADCVVWLMFQDAELSDSGKLHIGQITFYSGAALKAMLSSDEQDVLPPELRNPYGLLIADDLDGEVVAARVELRNHSIETAVDQARLLAMALVRHASLYSRWVWQLRRRHQLFVEGEFRGGSSGLGVHGVRRPRVQHPEAKRWVAEELEQRAERLAGVLLSDSDQAREVAVLLERVEVVLSGTDEVRLLLAPRLLERISRTVDANDDWPAFLKQYLGLRWAILKATQILAEDIRYCIRADMADYLGDVADEAGLAAAESELSTADGIDVIAACGRISSLLPLFAVGSTRAVRLGDSAQALGSGEALTAWLTSLESEFNTLVGRAERCRHALVHNWPTNGAVLKSAGGFITELAVDAVHLAIEGMANDGSARAGFREALARSTSTTERLSQATGSGIGAILFEPDPDSS